MLGLALGSLKYRGISLGSAGALFVGIVFGHFGETIDRDILNFVKDFGLVLFIFTIGLQLGPGFVAAMRQQGLKLNALAVFIVVSGAGIATIGSRVLHIDAESSLGIFCGATSNTPALGAAQQTLETLPGESSDRAEQPALAYAVSYPVGTVGIIGSLLVLRAIFKIDAVKEGETFLAEQQRGIEPLERVNLLVENRSLNGISLNEIPGLHENGVTVSRIRSAGELEVHLATPEMHLHVGDILLAVGTKHRLEQFELIIGRKSDDDLMKSPGNVTSRRIVVTRKAAVGKSIGELGWDHHFGVSVTRIGRSDLEMIAVPNLRLRFGDVVQVVGDAEALAQASKAAGNSVSAMNRTQFIPLFLGIALGVAAGLVPISLPGLPIPVRLGLAGGPLLLGIVLSRVGHIGNLIWHVPHVASMAFRELGITLFLASVGLIAGQNFFHSAFSRTGLHWALCAIATTMIPLLLAGIIARIALKMNFTTLGGLIAGSMTDPCSMTLTSSLTKSDGPSLAYATVYPLTMLLRILTAQVLALLLCR
jgi:putative transport protein